MPVSTVPIVQHQSNTEFRKNREKSIVNGWQDAQSVPPYPAAAGTARHVSRFRFVGLLFVLICLIMVSGRIERSPVWSAALSGLEYVRVSADLAHGSVGDLEWHPPVVHRAGWILDAIDALEEVLEGDGESSETIGDGEGDPDDSGGGGDGGGECEGECDDESTSGSDGDGEGDGDPAQTNPDQDEQSPTELSSDESIIELILAASDLGFAYSYDIETLDDDELILLLLELLEFLHDYLEETSSG